MCFYSALRCVSHSEWGWQQNFFCEINCNQKFEVSRKFDFCQILTIFHFVEALVQILLIIGGNQFSLLLQPTSTPDFLLQCGIISFHDFVVSRTWSYLFPQKLEVLFCDFLFILNDCCPLIFGTCFLKLIAVFFSNWYYILFEIGFSERYQFFLISKNLSKVLFFRDLSISFISFFSGFLLFTQLEQPHRVFLMQQLFWNS